MFARRLKPQHPAVKEAGTVILRESGNVQANEVVAGKAEVTATRKPSERFTRRPLKAKSRASHSERLRVEDLADRLQKTAKNDGAVNEAMKFKCYRPGIERPPG